MTPPPPRPNIVPCPSSSSSAPRGAGARSRWLPHGPRSRRRSNRLCARQRVGAGGWAEAAGDRGGAGGWRGALWVWRGEGVGVGRGSTRGLWRVGMLPGERGGGGVG